MGEKWIQGVVLAMVLIVIGVPFLLRPPAHAMGVGAQGQKLVIASPHSEQIRYEMARGFNLHRAAEGKPPIDFDWRSGGSSELTRTIRSQFEKLVKSTGPDGKGLENEGIGVDLYFGGGDFDHNALASGIEAERDGKKIKVPLSQPMGLSPEFLKEVFSEPAIAGVPLYQKDQRWVGAVLASFGIIYNRDLTSMNQVADPRTWTDLADGRYLHSVALADPSQSGSVRASYNLILRRLGWIEGWKALHRIYGNSRYFTASGAKVPGDVSSGECAAGVCIDFYGRQQKAAIGAERVGYVDPPKMTAITPDPISMLVGCKRPELAREFVMWLLSKEGQGIWQRRVGTAGGPEQYTLGRLPVRRDMYVKEEMATWTDEVFPFEIAQGFAPDTPDYFSIVAVITQAIAIDIHEDLTPAWAALAEQERREAGRPPSRQLAEMEALFDAMPEELTLKWPDPKLQARWSQVLANPKDPDRAAVVRTLSAFSDSLKARYADPKTGKDRMVEDRLRWALFFRENDRKIVAMSGGY